MPYPPLFDSQLYMYIRKYANVGWSSSNLHILSILPLLSIVQGADWHWGPTSRSTSGNSTYTNTGE